VARRRFLCKRTGRLWDKWLQEPVLGTKNRRDVSRSVDLIRSAFSGNLLESLTTCASMTTLSSQLDSRAPHFLPDSRSPLSSRLDGGKNAEHSFYRLACPHR
jgi:hypothetical protein